jgi:hypothetical protein
MANVSGAGTLWNLPNLDGMLFTPSQVQTSFVSRINRAATVQNTEFAMSSNYLLESAAQPAITETASLTAPTPTSYVRANEKNVNQIYQEKISLSYAKLSSGDRLRYAEVGTSGFAYNTAPGTNAAQSELDFQLRANLEQIRVNYEYTFLNGTYQLGTDAGTAYQSRGIITGSTTNTVAASAATLTKEIIDSLLIEMAGNGAFDLGGNMVIFANAFQVKKINDLYGIAPRDVTTGGTGVNQIVTPFGMFDVVYNPRVPTDTILFANMGACSVVFQPVPGKSTIDGNVVLEMLSKAGASEDWQLYAQLGVDYGSSYYHGTITGLATS